MDSKEWQYMGHGVLASGSATFLIRLVEPSEITLTLTFAILTASLFCYGLMLYRKRVEARTQAKVS